MSKNQNVAIVESETQVIEQPVVNEDALLVSVKALPTLSARIRYLMNHFENAEPKVASTKGATTKWLETNGFRTQKGTIIKFQQVRNMWLSSLNAKKK